MHDETCGILGAPTVFLEGCYMSEMSEDEKVKPGEFTLLPEEISHLSKSPRCPKCGHMLVFHYDGSCEIKFGDKRCGSICDFYED